MPVPGYQEFMLPMLTLASDGEEHTVTEAMETLAISMGISDTDREQMLPSGTQTQYRNRVQWASYYLYRSGLFERVARGRFRITARGRDVLRQNPKRIDNAFLSQFEEFRAFVNTKRPKSHSDGDSAGKRQSTEEAEDTPDERLDAAYKELRETLADDLLERVRQSTPKFFEQLVVDVLKAMGYGGPHASRAQVVGKSGDGGIDGVIPEDRLGLDMVYVQAKKWENPVGPDEIRKFVGSLGERRAHKGVFITSGAYTRGARDAAERANAKVVLIDGEQLVELMIDHGVGVADHNTYRIRKLDTDYFEGV